MEKVGGAAGMKLDCGFWDWLAKIFRFDAAPADGGWAGPPSVDSHPALLRCAGSSRRSGCVPAEPYPPPEQSPLQRGSVHFPFPFPWGSIGGDTGNGSLSWYPVE